MPRRGIRSPCCACVPSGHAAATLPSSVMKLRRRIAAPEAQDRASYRVKRADWKGSGVRTADVRFGSEADIEARPPDVRFTSESRHRGARLSCPLWAKSGHMPSLGERGNGGFRDLLAPLLDEVTAARNL